jgi:galactokinase/mevalonate kinase-like predicted kinase
LSYFIPASPENLPISLMSRCRNVISGNENSLQAMHDLKAEALHMKEALLKGNLDAVATAMRVSWAAKKKWQTG